MKFVIVVCVLGFLVAAFAEPHSRGCVYIMGDCYKECPEGTHSYNTGCSRMMPEATCDEPNPVKTEYEMCDFSACYCDAPTVRDTRNDVCVTLDQCPNKDKGGKIDSEAKKLK